METTNADDTTLDLDTPEETAPKVEEAPAWASSMADAMRAVADSVRRPAAPANPGLTKDQVDSINANITKGIVDGNPLGTLAPLASQVAQEVVDGRLNPVIAAAVDGFVDRFKSSKRDEADEKGQTGLYKQVAKAFEKELEAEDLPSLVSKTRAERDRILNRAWKAATGEVLEKKVATRPSRPEGASASGGSGGGGNSAGSKGATSYKLSDIEKRQLYRSMPKEAADAAIAEIEGALVGVTE